VNRIFSGRLTYDKGGAIIHTLRFVFNNDALFFQGLKNYQNTFKNGTATALDMKATMESVSGINLNDWMNEWFYGEGFPTFDVSWNQVANQLYVNVSHSTSSSVTPLFKTPLELKFHSTAGDTTLRININTNSDNFVIQLDNKSIDSIEIDPNNWIINDGGTRRDESLATSNISSKNQIEIYPSLVKDNIHIKTFLNELCYVKIVDMNGNLVQNSTINGIAQIDMQQFAAGSYSVVVSNLSGKMIASQKIIKL